MNYFEFALYIVRYLCYNKTKLKQRRGKMPERKITAQERWLKANSVTLSIRLMLRTEQDIIARLDEVDSKAGYIKRLIREDIARQEKSEG